MVIARRLRMPLAVFGCVLALTSRGNAGGGAWTRDVDGYYVKIGLSSLTADEGFGFDGRRRLIFTDTANLRNGTFGVTDIDLYGELGLTDWLTGVASTQYKVAVRNAFYRPTGLDSSASASGLGDLWLGARIRLLPPGTQYAAAVTLSMKLPTGTPLQEIPLGSGVVDYETSVAGGITFPVAGPMNGYAQLSTGFRFRNGIASNEITYLAEAGMHLSDDFTAQLILDGAHSFADFERAAADPEDIDMAKAFEADQSFVRWKGSMIYAVNPNMEINAGYSWIAGGRYVLALSGISIGVAWRR